MLSKATNPSTMRGRVKGAANLTRALAQGAARRLEREVKNIWAPDETSVAEDAALASAASLADGSVGTAITATGGPSASDVMLGAAAAIVDGIADGIAAGRTSAGVGVARVQPWDTHPAWPVFDAAVERAATAAKTRVQTRVQTRTAGVIDASGARRNIIISSRR